MEGNIILFQPWALVKFQVLNVFNYLKSEEKIILTGGLMRMSKQPPPGNEVTEIYSYAVKRSPW